MVGVLHGITQEVACEQVERMAVDADNSRGVNRRFKQEPFRRNQPKQWLGGFAHALPHRDVLQQFGRAAAGEKQERTCRFGETYGTAIDGRQTPTCVLRQGWLLKQQFAAGAYGRQWRTQFVRHVGREFLFAADEFHHLLAVTVEGLCKLPHLFVSIVGRERGFRLLGVQRGYAPCKIAHRSHQQASRPIAQAGPHQYGKQGADNETGDKTGLARFVVAGVVRNNKAPLRQVAHQHVEMRAVHREISYAGRQATQIFR